MAGNESPAHAELKRLALAWSQKNGFPIAGAEVSVPSLGACRLDAAAYRPDAAPQKDPATRRIVKMPRLGTTAVFECKSSRSDFLKDSRCEQRIVERLQRLHEKRALYEESMQRHFPTLRQGETLFPEFDVYAFECAGFEPYEQLTKEIRLLTRRLHQQTKFDKLLRWKAANVHYLVAEAGVVKSHELPDGWGLLIRHERELQLQVKPIWQDASEHSRWQLFLRIAMSGTRASNRQHGVNFELLPEIFPEAEKGAFQ